jgi:hypothetical protein
VPREAGRLLARGRRRSARKLCFALPWPMAPRPNIRKPIVVISRKPTSSRMQLRRQNFAVFPPGLSSSVGSSTHCEVTTTRYAVGRARRAEGSVW